MRVLVTVGGSEGIDLALRAMLDPGDEVLIPQPSYVSYLPCTLLADGVPVTIELKKRISSALRPGSCWKKLRTGPKYWYFLFRIILQERL